MARDPQDTPDPQRGPDDPASQDPLDQPTFDVLENDETLLVPAEVGESADEGRIDNYQIVDKLGEGGMGVVYLAEQLAPVRRQVALKIIKLGMDTRQVVARFESERQALAVMDHPAIARVYDAGATSTGRPYFVMELVRGERLTDYCDRNRLSIEHRLRLFMDICNGIQHAHQKGVIHRDLKPSNILVFEEQGRPRPKIIDFGVAKATKSDSGEQTDFTVVGQLVGTPAYMSPEQWDASGIDVDTRSDVYSLGVVLYELITGSQPYAKTRTVGDLQRMISETIPPRPSHRFRTLGDLSTEVADKRGTDIGALTRTLRGDLDWVVMMALEKDRDRRYQTASGMGLDIQRYLNNEPIRARPPSKAYRMKKFVRRNRLGVALVAALLLALLAGVAGTTFGLLRATAETRKARATRDFLKNMLSSVRSDRAQGREVTVREVLDEAAKSTALERTPEVRAEIEATVGTVYSDLGLYEQAQPHLQRAVELYTATLGERDPATLKAFNVLALNHWRRGELDLAETAWQKLMDTYLQIYGERHLTTLTAMQNVAALKMTRGNLEGVEALLIRVLEARRKIGEQPERTTATLNNLAHFYKDVGRLDEALPLFVEALEIRKQALGASHPRTLVSTFNLGSTLMEAGRTAEAEPLLRDATVGLERVKGADHPHTLTALAGLAEVLLKLGRLDECEALALDSQARNLARYGSDHEETIKAENLLIELYKRVGDTARAAKWESRQSPADVGPGAP